jgi:hypothetical protein
MHAQLCQKIADYLKTVPACWFYRTQSIGYGRRGIPDFVICYRSFFLTVEAKVPPDRPSPWQAREMKHIREAGGATIVAYTLDDVKRQIF